MQHLLVDLDPGGILTPHIQPLIARLNSLLWQRREHRRGNPPPRADRSAWAKRELKLAHFEKVGAALLRRKPPGHPPTSPAAAGQTTEREVSPQRLVYYRENWYHRRLVPPAQRHPQLRP
jgi:predicted DNA-binding transcriptional regulator YafY